MILGVVLNMQMRLLEAAWRCRSVGGLWAAMVTFLSLSPALFLASPLLSYSGVAETESDRLSALLSAEQQA